MKNIFSFLSLVTIASVNFYTEGLQVVLNPRTDVISNKVWFKQYKNPYGQKYYENLLEERRKKNESEDKRKYIKDMKRGGKKYPLSQVLYEKQLARLNSQNNSIRDSEIISEDLQEVYNNNFNKSYYDNYQDPRSLNVTKGVIVLNNNNIFDALGINLDEFQQGVEEMEKSFRMNNFGNRAKKKKTKSENFELIKDIGLCFKDVGGYSNVKQELVQCIDLLSNYTKYSRFNVRIPRGLIFEGPPGTGKTLLSKALAGEAKSSFIAVSGSDFQEKYVGVGSTRIKELFQLANENKPCIIFIDEIDALGRRRSNDGESSGSERDATLNALLVELDGFRNNSGIFVVSATNRIDLLDPALTRPGRIDKKVSLGLPDKETRRAILNIHLKGKPNDKSVKFEDLVETLEGFTGAQIENLLNEAMLYALRENREIFTKDDFELVLNRMMVGWQPNEHTFTNDIIDHITVHEMGHAILGIFSKHHSRMSKVVINLSSPRTPGYTVFETSTSNIHTRESLFEHLMILLGGRIAEELFFGASVTTGAINDFEEALKLAEKMVVYYGMGSNIVYPSSSDKYKELIDNDVTELINKAYKVAYEILGKSKDLMKETSEILKCEKLLTYQQLIGMINKKYDYLWDLKIDFSEND